jgi:PAS domain S-box-containing protein
VETSVRPLEDPEILRAILESMPTALYFVGRDQRIQFWNHSAERITGYLGQDVVGHFRKDFFPPQQDEDATGVCEIGGALSEVLRDGRPTCSDETIRHREGSDQPARVVDR